MFMGWRIRLTHSLSLRIRIDPEADETSEDRYPNGYIDACSMALEGV